VEPGRGMNRLFGQDRMEAIIGFLVVIVAVWFSVYAWERTGAGKAGNAIRVTALFPNAAGVSPGTEVRIAGMKIGKVTEQKLDPKSYEADVTLALDPKLKVPNDSSAAITSEGFLGATYIALVPGGSTTPFKDGDAILDTQGSMDLMGLVGQFINKTGGSASSSGATGNGATAPSTSSAGAGR